MMIHIAKRSIASSLCVARRVAALLFALMTVILTLATGCAKPGGVAAKAPASPTETTYGNAAAQQNEPGMEEDAPDAVPIYRVEPIDPDVINVLLVGTDSRAAHGALVSGNADTIILASYHRANKTVTLVSFLRDTVLTIGSLDGEYNKLKAAYRLGGMGLLINTVNSFFGLDVQNYVAIGLEGFAAFVDETLGGLDVELDAAEIAEINARIGEYENESARVKACPTVTDPPGRIHLNGTQTLLFVRNRSTAFDGAAHDATDYDRAARQQEVLRLMYEKFIAQEPLSAVPGIVRFALKHVETNMDADTIYALCEPLMTQSVAMHSVSVPFEGTWEYGGDGSGILFQREQTNERLHALLYPIQ